MGYGFSLHLASISVMKNTTSFHFEKMWQLNREAPRNGYYKIYAYLNFDGRFVAIHLEVNKQIKKISFF